MDNLDVPTSIRNSVKNLGLDYVDLYLVHNPRIAQPDIATVWAQMEKVREDGLAKCVTLSHIKPLLDSMLTTSWHLLKYQEHRY